ncbi:hypothetical protein GCM10020000_10620 [Streptomyces olivoverticillatus]
MGGGAEGAAVELGQAEDGVVGGDDGIGVAGEADAAAEAEALDGGHHRHLAVVDGGKGRGAALVDVEQGPVAGCALQLLDVDARIEAPPGGGEDDAVDRGVGARGPYRFGEVVPALCGKGVDGRVVDGDDGDARFGACGGDAHQLPFHQTFVRYRP